MVSWVVDNRTFYRDPTFHGVSCIIGLPQHALKIEWCISLSIRVVSTTKFRGLLFNLPCYIPLNGRTDTECRFGCRSIIARPAIIQNVIIYYYLVHCVMFKSTYILGWKLVTGKVDCSFNRPIFSLILSGLGNSSSSSLSPRFADGVGLLNTKVIICYVLVRLLACPSRTKQVSLRFLFTTD